MNKACPKIIGKNLTVAYGDYVLLQHADFTVNQGDVFIIMGASGGGKSSLLRVLTGLMPPAEGEVIVDGENFSGGDAAVLPTKLCAAAAFFTRAARCSVQ